MRIAGMQCKSGRAHSNRALGSSRIHRRADLSYARSILLVRIVVTSAEKTALSPMSVIVTNPHERVSYFLLNLFRIAINHRSRRKTARKSTKNDESLVKRDRYDEI